MMECEGGEIGKIANGSMCLELVQLFGILKYEKVQ